MAREIEFWFDFGSNYSYLSAMRIGDLAGAAGVGVRWRPFLLGPIFKSFGWETSPFVLQKEKGAYVWRDMERECLKYGLPWRRPTTFPRHSLLPVRIALYGEGEAWSAPFCQRVMLANFSENREINDQQVVAAILESLGVDAAATIAGALAEENKQRLRARTEQAKARGIFGAPTFFVGDEMFWGNDRLDDAMLLARGEPV